MSKTLCGSVMLALVLLLACRQAPASVTPVSSFETAADLAKWSFTDGTATLSDQHATQGRHSLHLKWPNGHGMMLSHGALPADWSGQDFLRLDAYNPGAPFHVILRTDDASGATISNWYCLVRSGKSTLEFSVRGLAERIDLHHVKMVQLRLGPPVSHPVEVYFDNLRFTAGEPREVYQPPVLPPAKPIPSRPNLLANPDFELGLQSWGSWGTWDGGDYSFGTGSGVDAHSGSYSAAIICNRKGRGGIMTAEPIALPATETYTLTFWAKSTEPSEVMYGLEGGGFSNYHRSPVTADWKRIEAKIQAPAGKHVRVYLMSVGTGTIYLDEVTLAGPKMPAPAARLSTAQRKPAHVEVRGDVLLVNGRPFFAIGIYRASPAELKGTGFNCIPGWAHSDQATLDACAAADIYMMPDLTGLLRGHLPQQAALAIKSLKSSPAVLAWYVCDEPDHGAWTVPPDELELARKVLRAADPNHPTCSVVMPWADTNLYRYADCVDILGADPYPIGKKKPTDFSSVLRANDVMRRATRQRKPTWSVIQGTADATPDEETAVVYLSITHGARGVLFWEYSDAHKKPEVWARIVQLTREMRDLTPALMSPDLARPAKSSNDAISVLAKQAPGGIVVIAVNGSDKPAAGVRLTVPGLGTKTGERLFGVAPGMAIGAHDGVLEDDFAPYQRHIYRFPSRP